ncbi:MAG TPA: B12-binding domain-containing protein, partial [Anaerolineales bacterium]|nr:B12-binding domain-containing protein [Anaerolineales bacterium]
MSQELLDKMAQSIIDGDSDVSVQLAQQAIAEGMDPLTAITDGFVVGVNTVGDAFAAGEAFLPELVMAGEAMKAAVATLEPELAKKGSER